MRRLILLLPFFPFAVAAQLEPLSTTMPALQLEDTTFFEFGPNYSVFAQRDVHLYGTRYEFAVNYSWYGFDDDEEEIDEIVVVAKRRVNRGWQLWSFVQWNLAGDLICTGYTDGGHCNMSQYVYDLKEIPVAGRCQTIQGETGPLTGTEANELNVDYLNGNAIGASLITASSAVLGSAAGGLPGTLIGAAGAIVTTMSGFIGELPFTAGDTVTWTLTVCNDGEGGVNSTMDVEIG